MANDGVKLAVLLCITGDSCAAANGVCWLNAGLTGAPGRQGECCRRRCGAEGGSETGEASMSEETP